MSAARGIIAGVLGLSMLEAIVSNQAASANTSGIIGFVSRGLARWLNPTTPLIPDLEKLSITVNVPGVPFGITTSSTAIAPSTPLPVGANAGTGAKPV